MKIEQVIEKLKSEQCISKQEIFVYASMLGIIKGVIGSVRGLVLLSVYEDVLYIHRDNIDNSYNKQLAKIYIPNMKNIQGKAGLFGGKFSFNYEGQEYKFKLPSKAGKFVDFFVR